MRWPAIVALGAVLALLWLALPVSIPESAGGGAREQCLTLADASARAGGSTIALLERCVALDPSDVAAMADLGAAYETAGDRAAAERMDGRVLSIDPDDADVRVRLARLLLRRGDAAGARREALDALRVQPNRKAVRDLLAEADAARGRPSP
jgi:Flp pilus assembly protein TadD